jgi:microcystin-dependent protein
MSSEPYLGTIAIFAGNFAPRGYMLCQGQMLAIAQNAALFSLLGTTYGGNGQTTFALPDLRGRAPIGAGQGVGLTSIELGQIAGSESTSISINNMPNHTHPLSASSQPAGQATPQGNFIAVPVDSTGNPGTGFNSNSNTQMAATSVGPTGGSQPMPIRNPCLGINYIIATQGLFPSRN